MKIFVILLFLLLQEKQTQCQPGYFGQGTKVRLTVKGSKCVFPFIYRGVSYNDCAPEITTSSPWCATSVNKDITMNDWEVCVPEREVLQKDDAICKDLEKDKCKRKAIQNLCPQMCSDGITYTNSAIDTSLTKLMEPILKVANNSKLCLKQAKEINRILDNIEDNIKYLNSTKTKVDKQIRATSCADRRLREEREYGLTRTQIFPYRYHSNHHSDYGVDVLCDQDRDGGGWTVIQMRRDVHPRENFHRDWHDYVEGFGLLDGEFWIGLKVIQELTSQDTQELHISLEDWEGGRRWARYSTFRVGSSSESYKLTISGYTGDAGDAMAYHNNNKFYTKDRDTRNCAKTTCKGGWWYLTVNACQHANLNGKQDRAKSTMRQCGINWYQWRGDTYSLRSVTMKMRPRHLYG